MIQDSQQPDYEVAITVNVSFSTNAQARSAIKALIPDNENLPKGLLLKMFSRGKVVFVEVKGKKISIKTIINTLDEVLEHISVARKIMAKGG